MTVPSTVDTAVRAVLELARHDGQRAKGDAVSAAAGASFRFVERLLADLRRAGIVGSRRGISGGYWLARPPEQITVADVIRGVRSPFADVFDTSPDRSERNGHHCILGDLWRASETSIRDVLEGVTIADLVADELPSAVATLLRG